MPRAFSHRRQLKDAVAERVFPLLRAAGFDRHPSERAWFGWYAGNNYYHFSFRHADAADAVRLLDLYLDSHHRRLRARFEVAVVPRAAPMPGRHRASGFTLDTVSAISLNRYRHSFRRRLPFWRSGARGRYECGLHDDPVRAAAATDRVVGWMVEDLPRVLAFFDGTADPREFRDWQQLADQVGEPAAVAPPPPLTLS